MGPTWVLSAPDRPHVSPMNLAIRVQTHVKLELQSKAGRLYFSQGLLNTVDQSVLDLPLLDMTNIYLNNAHYHSIWQLLHQQLKGHGQSFHMYNVCNTLWYTFMIILVDSRGNPQLKTKPITLLIIRLVLPFENPFPITVSVQNFSAGCTFFTKAVSWRY